MSDTDLASLRAWIGRTETASDLLSPRLMRAFDATLDVDRPALRPGDPAPPGILWCLAPASIPAAGLGPDGHAKPGGFLPPVPLPRRMWAGGRLRFHDPLRVGDLVERRSTIVDVRVKQGRTGPLCFVAVDHIVSTSRGLAVEERQDIVYREIAPPSAATPSTPAPDAEWRRPMQADSVLLFRYSALTFNAHRIHYDRPYARDVEFYPDLVVHGPLQATWLLAHAEAIRLSPPRHFTFRALEPLFDTDSITLCATSAESGLTLWIETRHGRRTMEAQAGW